MKSLNKVQIIGNVGKDPEVKATQAGTKVASFSVATTAKWKDKAGAWQEKTEWHKVTAWEPLAVVVSNYVKKGDRVYVEGYLETQKWQDKNGVDRYTTQIVARDLIMLGGKRAEAEAEGGSESGEPKAKLDDDEDMPF